MPQPVETVEPMGNFVHIDRKRLLEARLSALENQGKPKS